MEKIIESVMDKFPDTENTKELIEFIGLIRRFGLNFVKEVYPKKLFAANLEILKESNLLDLVNTNNDAKMELDEAISNINSINIDWMHYFVVFAEVGNTTDAIKLLKISRQALIKAITGIESQLKVSLVERQKHFKGLTIAGQLFYEKSKTILQNLYDMDIFFSDLRGQSLKGKIQIGWTTLWGIELLPQAVNNFIKKFPEAYPRLYSMSQQEIEKWVSAGELGIGLIGLPPERDDLEFIEGPEINYVVVGKPRRDKNTSELSFIIPYEFNIEKNNNNRPWFDEKFKVKVIMESDSIEMTLNICEKGEAAVFVPEIIARERIKRGTLEIIAEPPFKKTTRLYIIWNKKIHLSKLAREMIKDLKKMLL
jgi:DNA-binding transcriptional LysR family regulator